MPISELAINSRRRCVVYRRYRRLNFYLKPQFEKTNPIATVRVVRLVNCAISSPFRLGSFRKTHMEPPLSCSFGKRTPAPSHPVRSVKMPSQPDKSLLLLGKYLSLALTLPASVVAGYIVGALADHWLHIPFLRVLGILLGIATGLMQIIRELLKEDKKGSAPR